jgi:hypothetical protein
MNQPAKIITTMTISAGRLKLRMNEETKACIEIARKVFTYRCREYA